MPLARSSVASVISSPSAPANAFIRQFNSNNFPGQPGDDQNENRSLSLTDFDVLPGSAILVFGTQENEGVAVPYPDLSDTINSSGGTYVQLKKLDDIDSPDGLLTLFIWLLSNSAAGPFQLNAVFNNLEWQGLFAAEVANVKASPLIDVNGQSFNGFTSTATDGLSSGNLVGGGKRGIIISIGQSIADFGVANGGSGLGRPNAGTGYTPVVSAADQGIWPLGGREGTSNASSAMVAFRSFPTGMPTTAATFTGNGGRADDVNIGAVALEGLA